MCYVRTQGACWSSELNTGGRLVNTAVEFVHEYSLVFINEICECEELL